LLAGACGDLDEVEKLKREAGGRRWVESGMCAGEGKVGDVQERRFI
jgi:hypothetical protein